MILEVDAVDTFYGETQALFGASLAVERGQVFALLGPNGAGKTTMLRSILGLTRPRRGAIRFAAANHAHHARDRPRASLCAGRPAACPTLTVRAICIEQTRTRFKVDHRGCDSSRRSNLMARDAEIFPGGECRWWRLRVRGWATRVSCSNEPAGTGAEIGAMCGDHSQAARGGVRR